jgi:hypothetical protein
MKVSRKALLKNTAYAAALMGFGINIRPRRGDAAMEVKRPQDFGSNVGVGDVDADTVAFDDMFASLVEGDVVQLDPVPVRGDGVNPSERGYLIDMGGLAQQHSGNNIWELPSNVTVQGTLNGNNRPDRNAGVVIMGSHTAAIGHYLFTNADQFNGNDDITIQNLYVHGRKYQHDGMFGVGPAWSIDDNLKLVRFRAAHGSSNERIKFLRNDVIEWLGIVFDLHYGDDFDVNDNYVFASHRGSLIFRYYNRNGRINNNVVHKCGDDAIALNSQESNPQGEVNTEEAANIEILGNELGEKRKQDIQQPWDDRYRGGNSPLHIVGGRNITIGKDEITRNRIVSMFNGDNGPLGEVNPDASGENNGPWANNGKNGRNGARQPAVDIETRDGDGLVLRNINIRWLRIVPSAGANDSSNKCKGLRVIRTDTTGHLGDGYYPTYDAAGCPWQITPDAPNWTLNDNNPNCRR